MFKRFEDIQTLYELGQELGDEAAKSEAIEQYDTLSKDLRRFELILMMNDELDGACAFLDINSGAGGTEAQDWVSMLLRMYLRFCERRGFKADIIDVTDGQSTGYKSVTIKIEGERAYGWLKKESGVHRLVRISPFDANKRRHTSFASVSVLPILTDDIAVEILDKDLRIDTYRASGAGGQHVNKTESAVRITHLPTGIVTQCQTDRSQHRNKAYAMSMLKAKLYELKKKDREQVGQFDKTDIGWGHQIRSYVLHPYQLVKDARTSLETGNTQAVLDGDIDDFLESALLHDLKQPSL